MFSSRILLTFWVTCDKRYSKFSFFWEIESMRKLLKLLFVLVLTKCTLHLSNVRSVALGKALYAKDVSWCGSKSNFQPLNSYLSPKKTLKLNYSTSIQFAIFITFLKAFTWNWNKTYWNTSYHHFIFPHSCILSS